MLGPAFLALIYQGGLNTTGRANKGSSIVQRSPEISVKDAIQGK
jgi:hypothetical protein